MADASQSRPGTYTTAMNTALKTTAFLAPSTGYQATQYADGGCPRSASRAKPVIRYTSAQSPAWEAAAVTITAINRLTPVRPATRSPDPAAATHGAQTTNAAAANSPRWAATERTRARRVARLRPWAAAALKANT